MLKKVSASGWLWFSMLPLVFLMGCQHILCQREYYPDGRPAGEQAFLVLSDGSLVPHGLHWTWFPDGMRRSLEIFVRGEREGYSMRWDGHDSLIRLDYCADGVCEPRVVSGGAGIASVSFR